MDDILAKHLATTFLLPTNNIHNSLMVEDESIIPYHSYKIIDNLFYIKTDGNPIVSENIGYWKDKPIIEFNNNKYVLLETSNNIVRIDNLGIRLEDITSYVIDTKNKEKQISDNLLKNIKNIITSNKPIVKEKNKQDLNNTKIIKKQISKPRTEIKDTIEPITRFGTTEEIEDNSKLEVPSQTEIVKMVNGLLPKETSPNNSVISSYIDTLKKSDQQLKNTENVKTSTNNYIDNDKPKTVEDEMFSLLETKKDDPRIKRLFSYYAEQTKKEVHEINEKYSKQYLAKVLESSGGGGTNAVQYANGGIMNGDLTITSNLSVLGEINNKKVFTIGNGIDLDYVLDHNFNTKDLVISVYDSNDEIVLVYIKNINNNQTLISFNVPMENIKVVIMK